MGLIYKFFLFTLAVCTTSVFASTLSPSRIITKRAAFINELTDEQKSDLFTVVKADPLNLIHKDFVITDYFAEATHFWFKIYTEYTSDQVVMHSRDKHSIIFNVLDVTGLVDQPRSKRISQERDRIRERLKEMAQGNDKCTVKVECQAITKALENSLYPPPKGTKKRSEYFSELSTTIRSQTGQKNIIYQGLINILPFEKKINEIFHLYEVPGELLAISFLESSFNTKARSRVGAAGVWQFMRRTGQEYFTITQKEDHRLNPLISTLGALQMLKQSHKILGRWDLSIWAYNSGMGHILAAKKKLKIDNMSLELFLENYENAQIGFASRSFYSSYLALVHALSYKKNIYFQQEESPLTNPLRIDRDNIHFYVALCSVSPSFVFSALNKTSPDITELNTHFLPRYYKAQYPRGTIFISDRPLTSRRYFKVPPANYTNRYPKNWRRLIENQSCSTR